MRVLIDTCVVIDALQNREPFYEEAEALFLMCANRVYEGFITAKELTDIYYLTHKQTHSKIITRAVLSSLCSLFVILDTSAIDIQKAISSDIDDFEDAVMIETAIRTNMDCIITRNTKDFSTTTMNIYTPFQFLSMFPDE